MRNFAVRPHQRRGRHGARVLVVALVVLATSMLGGGLAFSAPAPDVNSDVQCNGTLSGLTPNDPIMKTATSPHDNPATVGIVEAYPGDVISYTITWTPKGGVSHASLQDCFVVDPVFAATALSSSGSDPANGLATATIDGTLVGTDLGFPKDWADTNPGTYSYSMTIPSGMLGHTFANRAKVEQSQESKSNWVLVAVIPAPNVPPTVSCPTMSANGLSVSYTANATDSDGTITNYHWVFGDGQTADTASNTTSHTYASGGTYNVTVTVTDDDGATGSSSGACSITVTAPPQNVAPTVSCPTMSADGLTVSYTANASDSDGTITNYHWVFGDGQTADTASNTTSHTYAADGTYNVTVTVTDDDGATGSSSGACSITVAAPPVPNVPPVVSCPGMSVNGLSVAFTAAGTDADGTITNYHWVFGDGQTADTASGATSHTYAADGTFNITVTVTDNDGATGSSSGTCAATVAAPVIPNNPPVVSCPTMSADGLDVDYTASASDSDGTITNYHWVFGDGQTADTASNTTSHTYASAGTFNVTVTVTDDDGATGSNGEGCSVTVADEQTPPGPVPTPPVPTVVLPERKELPKTGTETTSLAWIAAALLISGALMRVRIRPVRGTFGSSLVAQQVAAYGLMLAANARPARRHAFRRM